MDPNEREEEQARRAHRNARATLTRTRAAWLPTTPTRELGPMLAERAPSDAANDLACLYLFAAKIGGANAEDPAVAMRWLSGWSAARERVPDDGRAALDAGIAFATRLHEAMGLDETDD
jgi:hypothetical protein